MTLLEPDANGHTRLARPARTARVGSRALGDAQQAQRDLAPPPECCPAQRPRARTPSDALAGLRVRLTGRTVSVLAVVAAEPGLSNGELCARSSVTDRAQMSKLLKRLDGLGLIESTATGEPQGAPNAWSLTARGAQLERVMRGARELGLR